MCKEFITLNGLEFEVIDVWTTVVVNMWLYFLHYTCLMNLFSNVQVDSLDEELAVIVQKKCREFELLTLQPETLEKLCIITIRSNMPCKHPYQFSKLPLAVGLIRLVKLEHMAEYTVMFK